MKKRIKKAFTLVELLVVIAILAVLSTVAVVGYNSFTEKARLSNDQTTIQMMNGNLRAATVADEPETATDALKALRQYGVVGDKLKPYSKNYQYAYDNAGKQFVLLNENDKVVFPESAKENAELWIFFNPEVGANGTAEGLVSGAEGYILTRSMTKKDAEVLKNYFGSTKLELGGFVCSFSQSDIGNVEIVPNTGVLTHSDFSSVNGFMVDARNQYTSVTTDSITNDRLNAQPNSYNNVVFDGGINLQPGTYTFTDCVFVAYDTNNLLPRNAFYNLEFTNCTFITIAVNTTENYQVIDADPSDNSIFKFTNCEFNGQRGIAIGNNTTVEVNDCEFNLPVGDSDNYAFRWYENNAAKIIVKNTVFNSCESVIQVRVTNSSLSAPVDCVFSGNTYRTLGGSKVVAHKSNTNTNILSYFKEIVK